MNKNVVIAKELVKLARNLVALDEEGDGSGFQMLIDHDNFEQYELDRLDELDRAEKEGKKYILYKKEHGLWRIRACKNFNDVKKGDLGGLVGSEENLSHEGDAWVYDNAQVYAKAEVYDNAQVYDNAKVYGGAWVYGNAKVYGNARVHGGAVVRDNAQVYDNAHVFVRSHVCGNAKVYGDAKVWVWGEDIDFDVSAGSISRINQR